MIEVSVERSLSEECQNSISSGGLIKPSDSAVAEFMKN